MCGRLRQTRLGSIAARGVVLDVVTDAVPIAATPFRGPCSQSILKKVMAASERGDYATPSALGLGPPHTQGSLSADPGLVHYTLSACGIAATASAEML